MGRMARPKFLLERAREELRRRVTTRKESLFDRSGVAGVDSMGFNFHRTRFAL
jgi:hypothetical protein